MVGGGGCTAFREPAITNAEVARVVDGDTVVLRNGQRLRYIGIDTPEIGDNMELYGPQATEFNEGLVEGRRVVLERDSSNRDRFGRLLRFVYVDGILVNAELVREGYAIARVYLPDTTHAQCFAALQQEAMEARRGMWGR